MTATDTITAFARPATTKWLCRLKDNPYKVCTGIVGGVTLSRFKEIPEVVEGRPDPKTGVATRRHTGNRWREEPVCLLDDATVERFKARLPFAVLRPGAGIVKLDANWRPIDPVTRQAGAKYVAPPSEGDLPLADYVDFRPWGGPSDAEAAELRVENERLKRELAEFRAKQDADDAEEKLKAVRADAFGVPGDREVGPRRKKE